MKSESNDVLLEKHFQNITTFIGERLSPTPTKLRQYINLMRLFRSRLIEGDTLIECLQFLFREDECLSKMFDKLMETEIREMKKKEAMEPITAIEEGEIIEEYRRCRIHVRLRCKIAQSDLPIKKRRKYRSEPSGPEGPYELKSTVNRNCGEVS
ncbi:hypothetical protein Bca4012_024451 [Brassica carinata]